MATADPATAEQGGVPHFVCKDQSKISESMRDRPFSVTVPDGVTEIGGRLPVNTDGGCLANGEPVGASGLRQVHEVCVQLRGDGGARQVPNEPKVGYTHVYGAPGISGVNILAR